MDNVKIGVIGGSGLDQIDGAEIIKQITIKTPWGKPSDKITISKIDNITYAFLPRHGKGHFIPPHEVNSRANIAALKMLGVEEIIAFSAVGSLKEEIKPTDFILPSQVIDRTKNRPCTFFENGIVAHIAFADPFCSRMLELIHTTAKSMDIKLHLKETVICMEGPAFSTRSESHLYRSWGAGIINMSTLPEAKLAREAEICYAIICMSTDYDSWRENEEHVTVEMLINNLNKNSSNAKLFLKNLLPHMAGNRSCGCREAVKSSILTAPEKLNTVQKKKLNKLLPQYF